MTDRTVKVSLILAAQGYFSGMDAVQQKTAQTGSEIEKLNQKRQAFTQLGTSAIGFGAAAAAGVGVAISKFADFDQQMSYVQAATHETASNMNLLRDAALEAGARTVYSATEAAGAIEELAKAGVTTKDILSGGLDAALDLAAAGGLDVADAAGIAATALKTFKLEGEDMSHVADLLAAGAGKATGDVSELAQALAQGGLVAKSTGLSIEETTAGLAAFAENGLRGSDAGTSFKSMLQRLTPQSAEARDEMDRLGISAYNSQGQFIGLANFAGNLQQSLKDLTPEQRNAALATIFGADAVRAANVLYENGAEGIQDWTDKVNDSGYAAETAALRLDNLKGDVEQLGGALDTSLIQSGSGANDALRSLVQIATGAVGVFSDLPEPVQQAAVYLGLAAAGVGLVGGAALVATPRIAEFRAITAAAGFSMKGLALSAGLVTIGLAAVIGIVAAVATAQADARAKAQAYADTLEEGTRRVTKATRDLVKENLAAAPEGFFQSYSKSAYDAAESIGISLQLVTDAAMGEADALREVEELTEKYADGARSKSQATREKAAAANAVRDAVKGESESIDEAIRVSEQKASVDEEAADAADVHSAALDELAGKATSAEVDIKGLADAIRGFGSAQLDTREAARQLEQSFDDLQNSINENGATLDIAEQAGRDNQAALDDLATSALELAAATVQQTGSQEDANRIIADGRQRLIEMLAQFGITGQAAEDYANELGLIPDQVATAVQVNGIDAAERALERITRERQVNIWANVVGGSVADRADRASGNFSGNYYQQGKVKAFATGGFASGIYPATPGGIHKFAEAGHDEAYITMDPAYATRSRAIWEQVGVQLGVWNAAPEMTARAWQPAAPSFAALPTARSDGPLVEVKNYGNNYSYDPHDIARAQREQLTRALDALPNMP